MSDEQIISDKQIVSERQNTIRTSSRWKNELTTTEGSQTESITSSYVLS